MLQTRVSSLCRGIRLSRNRFNRWLNWLTLARGRRSRLRVGRDRLIEQRTAPAPGVGAGADRARRRLANQSIAAWVGGRARLAHAGANGRWSAIRLNARRHVE